MCLWAISTILMSFGDKNAKFPKYEEIFQTQKGANKYKVKDFTPMDVIDMFRGKGKLVE